jgi:RNA polymerase sigma-70 factor (ECF subfamily)
MLRIASKLDRFRGDSRFTTWAMAIAIRTAYTALRRRRWAERSLDDLGLSIDTPSSAADPTADAGRRDLMGSLRAAIDEDLTPRQRTAVLGELAGMPVPVLAEQLGTNPNALYKLHHDARLRLRSALEQRGFSQTDVRGMLRTASNG